MAPKDYTGVDDPSIISETIVMPSTLETIDTAIFDWLNEKLDIFCDTNKGFEKVPVLWLSAERAHQIKNNKEIRDDSGFLRLPLIVVNRTGVTKDPTRKGIFQAHVPPETDKKGGSIVIARKINQDKTSNFANADTYKRMRGGGKYQLNFPRKNEKVVYETISIPMPVHINLNYSIELRAEYQQQMNEMMTPFMTRTGNINHFVAYKDGHNYEGFIQQDFENGGNAADLGTSEKIYSTKVNIRVLGYLIGEDKNAEQPKIVVRENAVEVKIPRERVIYGDIPEHIDERGFYRE